MFCRNIKIITFDIARYIRLNFIFFVNLTESNWDVFFLEDIFRQTINFKLNYLNLLGIHAKMILAYNLVICKITRNLDMVMK